VSNHHVWRGNRSCPEKLMEVVNTSLLRVGFSVTWNAVSQVMA
jgi:hypothetical protein